MIGQIQLVDVPRPGAGARSAPARRKTRSSPSRTACTRTCVARGGGARDVEVRVASDAVRARARCSSCTSSSTPATRWARTSSTRCAEGVAPLVEEIAGGKVLPAHPLEPRRPPPRAAPLRDPRRRARAARASPASRCATASSSRAELRRGRSVPRGDPQQGHHERHRRASRSPPATTGARSRPARTPTRRAAAATRRSRAGELNEDGDLVGRIELPLAVGTVGGPLRVEPRPSR